jgi:hypothetical protein
MAGTETKAKLVQNRRIGCDWPGRRLLVVRRQLAVRDKPAAAFPAGFPPRKPAVSALQRNTH